MRIYLEKAGLVALGSAITVGVTCLNEVKLPPISKDDHPASQRDYPRDLVEALNQATDKETHWFRNVGQLSFDGRVAVTYGPDGNASELNINQDPWSCDLVLNQESSTLAKQLAPTAKLSNGQLVAIADIVAYGRLVFMQGDTSAVWRARSPRETPKFFLERFTVIK